MQPSDESSLCPLCLGGELGSSAMRKGFTLIEMMVATALTMFIMAILSQAFVTSLDVFSGLKGLGDMEANLRTAGTLMRADLAADHFEGKRRLSDPDFWIRESTRVY